MMSRPSSVDGGSEGGVGGEVGGDSGGDGGGGKGGGGEGDGDKGGGGDGAGGDSGDGGGGDGSGGVGGGVRGGEGGGTTGGDGGVRRTYAMRSRWFPVHSSPVLRKHWLKWTTKPVHAGSDKHVVQQSDGWAVEGVADMEEVWPSG